jgi:hypothetical protein
VPNNPSKHWNDCSGWEIAKSLCNHVLIVIKEKILFSPFFSIFVDEVITIDNQSWICIHYCAVASFMHVPILLTFEHLGDGGTTTQTSKLSLMTYGGLFQNQIVKHLVCLGADGASTFQGVRPKVIALMKMEQTPYFIGIHCMAHKTNHVVHNLSSMPMVSKLENLLQLFLVPPNTILNLKNLLKLWK